MRWIIGVDVGRRTRGALQFARWLAEAMGESGRDAVIPVHVLHEEHLRMMLRYHRLDEVIEAERAGVSRQVAEVMQRGDLGVESVLAVTVEQGLEAERARQGATGVIVARAAPAEGGGVFRLGGVARRLLRRLASPVIVVPPDLTQARIGDGPVVALSNLRPESAPACRLARSLADMAHRDLSVVHIDDALRAGAARRPAPTRRDDPAGPFGHRERALARWVARHGVWPDVATVIDGAMPSEAVAFAVARRSPLVVTGAHPYTNVRDALDSRPWRSLAAHARQAVLVVPAARRSGTDVRSAGAAAPRKGALVDDRLGSAGAADRPEVDGPRCRG